MQYLATTEKAADGRRVRELRRAIYLCKTLIPSVLDEAEERESKDGERRRVEGYL